MNTCLPDGKDYPYEDRLINDFAIRSFRDFADGDYIAARMAYRHQLVPQFLWSGLQALEKYLKCIATLNRVPVRQFRRHELRPLLDVLRSRLPFNIKLSKGSEKFVDYLDTYGPYRYFESSYHIHGPAVMKLDLAVWETRRYAHVLDYYVMLPGRRIISMLQKEIAKLEQAEDRPHSYAVPGGLLESIVSKPKHPSREPLLWQNAWYGKRRRKSARLATYLQGANSPLWLHPEILDRVAELVYLPRDVRQAYRLLALEKRD